MNYHKTMTPISRFNSDTAWAATAITLGVWETVALTTKKVPTISNACWSARKRHARKTEAAVILWLTGLGAHLLKRASEQ